MISAAQFLVVDDEQEVCNFFSYLLAKKGYAVTTATSGRQALARLKEKQFNVALVDLKLPDHDGLSLLREIKKEQPGCEVIIITGYSTVKSAVEAIQLGAFDYIEKPFVDIDQMEKLLENALHERAELVGSEEFRRRHGFVVGRNARMLNLLAAARKVAKKNITVLIQGETGTGKEVLARYIHAISHRSHRPFLAFNCGAFTETLLESELFGHEKGSFTGATGRKRGIFELAHQGTLFLDEIDSASPAIQVKLLRVLETGEFLRVGGEELCKVDVRIIAATNADLAGKVEENKFREDLFYRLDVASLCIPPLRERVEDIPLFINYFLEQETKGKGLPSKKFDDASMELLIKHPWPGNIRELANTVAQCVLLSKGNTITVEDLPARIVSGNGVHEARAKTAPLPPPAGEGRTDKGQSAETGSAAAARPAPVSSPEAAETLPVQGEALPVPVNLFQEHPQQDQLNELLQHFATVFLEGLDVRRGFDFNRFLEDMKSWQNYLSRKIIELSLETTYDNQVQAARLLHITPRALRYYLKEKDSKEKADADN